MMDVDFLPDYLVILGGSYIGLEFAQMYRRFGSEVSIVAMAPRLISTAHVAPHTLLSGSRTHAGGSGASHRRSSQDTCC
jgi:pyruvate/2-oxoglutarate dehydrogenase complex dihydrolipoamide dehydrogenase (E3) component